MATVADKSRPYATIDPTLKGKVAKLGERVADPADPSEGQAVIWQSDGTDAGDDGDIMVKITAGGVTATGTIVDYSTL